LLGHEPQPAVACLLCTLRATSAACGTSVCWLLQFAYQLSSSLNEYDCSVSVRLEGRPHWHSHSHSSYVTFDQYKSAEDSLPCAPFTSVPCSDQTLQTHRSVSAWH
jgi:hypothetical protein